MSAHFFKTFPWLYTHTCYNPEWGKLAPANLMIASPHVHFTFQWSISSKFTFWPPSPNDTCPDIWFDVLTIIYLTIHFPTAHCCNSPPLCQKWTRVQSQRQTFCTRRKPRSRHLLWCCPADPASPSACAVLLTAPLAECLRRLDNLEFRRRKRHPELPRRSWSCQQLTNCLQLWHLLRPRGLRSWTRQPGCWKQRIGKGQRWVGTLSHMIIARVILSPKIATWFTAFTMSSESGTCFWVEPTSVGPWLTSPIGFGSLSSVCSLGVSSQFTEIARYYFPSACQLLPIFIKTLSQRYPKFYLYIFSASEQKQVLGSNNIFKL